MGERRNIRIARKHSGLRATMALREMMKEIRADIERRKNISYDPMLLKAIKSVG